MNAPCVNRIDYMESQYTTKIICATCGEETAGNPSYSFYGSVHKWGPRDHPFRPCTIYVKAEDLP